MFGIWKANKVLRLKDIKTMKERGDSRERCRRNIGREAKKENERYREIKRRIVRGERVVRENVRQWG